jgi:trigger factor
MACVATEVQELGDNRVRLTVEVSAHDVSHAYEHALSDLSSSVKVPGFRKGKIPAPVLVSRIGRERIYAEAVDSHIGGWFWNAAARNRLRPIAQPEFDYELPANNDEGWSFSATVEVQPPPDLVDWRELEVPRLEVDVPAEAVDAELETLRNAVAELVPAEDRPAREGDTVVVDLVSPSGEAQRDTVVELGAGRLVEELEAALVGASAGETRQIEYELADDSKATVEVTVKEIKEKVLPPADDDLARAASEFDTLAELRADIEGRLREQLDAEVESAFRSAAVDELVSASRVQPAGPLVDTRAAELLSGFVRSLQSRGISPENYLALTGVSAEQLQAQLRGEAAQSVAREIALDALADRMGIEVPDEEVDAFVREQAVEAGEDPDRVVADIWAHGRHETLRDDMRLRAALDRLVEEVKPISTELAAAREQIWTPDKETPETETKLWTPGSKEPA